MNIMTQIQKSFFHSLDFVIVVSAKSVFFDSIEEIDSCVVVGVGGETVECFRENVVKIEYFRERSIVNASEHGKRDTVGYISPVRSGKRDCCVDQCTRHLLNLDVDAPSVVIWL